MSEDKSKRLSLTQDQATDFADRIRLDHEEYSESTPQEVADSLTQKLGFPISIDRVKKANIKYKLGLFIKPDMGLSERQLKDLAIVEFYWMLLKGKSFFNYTLTFKKAFAEEIKLLESLQADMEATGRASLFPKTTVVEDTTQPVESSTETANQDSIINKDEKGDL